MADKCTCQREIEDSPLCDFHESQLGGLSVKTLRYMVVDYQNALIAEDRALRAMVLGNDTAALIVNMRRHWKPADIEALALHLLGDEWQVLRESSRLLVSALGEVEALRSELATCKERLRVAEIECESLRGDLRAAQAEARKWRDGSMLLDLAAKEKP